MPRLQRSADEEQALGDAVPEGWVSFSKQIPTRWALFSLWLCGEDGFEVIERRHFTRGFCLGDFQSPRIPQDCSMRRLMQRLAQDSSGSALLPQGSGSSVQLCTPKTPAQSPRSRETPHEAAGRVRAGFVPFVVLSHD